MTNERPGFSFRSLFGFLSPKRAPAAEAPARVALDPARTASFDPQVARRMSQLEAELTRIAESQYSAREERLKLAEEVARLRAAAGGPAKAPAPRGEAALEPAASEITSPEMAGTS